jgi:hypothetical protein
LAAGAAGIADVGVDEMSPLLPQVPCKLAADFGPTNHTTHASVCAAIAKQSRKSRTWQSLDVTASAPSANY